MPRPRLNGFSLSIMVALGASPFSGNPVWAEFSTPVAVTNVTIVSGDGPPIEGGVLFMAEGRILAVGKEIDLPAQAERIDGTGMIAYPGFIDAGAHLGIGETKRTPEERRRTEDVNPDPRESALAATRFADRRGIRPQIRALEQYVPDETQLLMHRGVGFTSALIAPRDGLLGGTSTLLNLSGAPIRRSVLVSDAAMHGSFIVGEEGEYPETLLGVFAQFRQVMLDARGHAKMHKYEQRHTNSGPRVPTDPALEALQPLLSRAQRLIFEANTENEIRRALDLARDFNLDIAISGAKEAWKVVDRIKAERVPLIVSLKFDEEPEFGRVETPDAPLSEDEKKVALYEPIPLRQERRRLWEEQVSNCVRLHETGVAFALRARNIKKPTDFFKNLRMVIRRGLPEAAAVSALSATPAEWLGAKGQLGAIRPGFIANLTLMNKPLSDENSQVALLFIDGKKFEVDHEALREAEKKLDDKKEETKKPGEATAPEKIPPPATTDEKRIGPFPEPTWAIETIADRLPKKKTGGDVLVKNATIIPVTSPTLEFASILIRKGKIEAIGPNLVAPDGVTVIDAMGRFVLPGLVDCHSHLAIDGVNESPLAISAEVRIADTINPHEVGLYRALAGGTTTHHAMHGSANPIGGQNAIFKLKYERLAVEMLVPDAPRVIKFALGENVVQANFPNQWDKRYPNTRMGVEATIRTAFEAAKTYQAQWDRYEEQSRAGADVPIPRRDLRLEALAQVLSGNMTVHAHCYRSDEILRLFSVAEEYGIRIGTLHHVLEGYRIAPEIARHGCGTSTFSNDWAYKVEAYEAIPHNAAVMTLQGINTSVNSDSPLTIRYLNQEAAKCVRWGGLNESQALRLVTINSAMQLQIDHRVGSLEAGKDGDLAIFNGHPLNTFSKCVMTLIDGEIYFEDPRPEPVEPAHRFSPIAHADLTIPATPHRAFAIVGATVHPMSGPVIEGATVVILEDKIHAVGSGAAVLPGAGVIDGAGLHVYPGLIDAGGAMGLTEVDFLRATRDFQEIGTFNPHVRAASAVHPHSAHIRVARTAGITTALTRPTGGRIAGQSAVIHLDGWTTPEMLLVDAFGLHMTLPSLPVHLPEDQEAKKKLVEEHKKATRDLEEFFARAKHYAKVQPLAASDPSVEFEVDLTLQAMVPYVRGEKPVVFSASTHKTTLDAVTFAEKHGLRCVLYGGQQSWKLADFLARRNIPVILSSPLGYPADEFEPWDSVYRCAGELDRAGVSFCFASDSAAEAYNLGTQVGMTVAHGLPRERGEYAVTLGAAKMLGIADRVGSIEVGKQADLIVVSDSPLQTSSVVTHMFIDGRPIELTSRQTDNYEKFKNRPAPSLPPPASHLRGPKSLAGR